MVPILDMNCHLLPFLGDNLNEERLDMIRGFVESLARKHVHHDISQNTRTEFYRQGDIGAYSSQVMYDVQGGMAVPVSMSGQDSQVLQLDCGYVRSITSVWEDFNAKFGQGPSDFGGDTLLASGSDYMLQMEKAGLSKTGRVHRLYGGWSSAPGTIKVTYVNGLTSAELDDEYSFVRLALMEEIREIYYGTQNSGLGPVAKKIYHGDVTTEYAVDRNFRNSSMSLSSTTKQRLQPIVAYIL